MIKNIHQNDISTIQSKIGYDLIISEITESSRVLDLGCGDGTLLDQLVKTKKVKGFGVEISQSGVSKCVEKGLYVYQGDIDEGLSDYKGNSFEYVILNQTLQSTKKPLDVLKEILRISRNAIISFPNFAYFRTRLQLLINGTMPKNKLIPYEWYESPNIHHLTIKDFQHLCKENDFPIEKEFHFTLRKDGTSKPMKFIPNMFAQHGFFILDGKKFK